MHHTEEVGTVQITVTKQWIDDSYFTRVAVYDRHGVLLADEEAIYGPLWDAQQVEAQVWATASLLRMEHLVLRPDGT